MSFSLSVVLPVHNEEAILERNVLALARHLDAFEQLDEFEILLVCNGCCDGSERVSAALAERQPRRIRAICLDVRGLGHAIRAGITAASHEFVMFYAVDLPFGLEVIDASVTVARANPNAIVIGSKGHAASVVPRDVTRRMFSRAAGVFINAMFGLGVSDTQGSLLFPKAVFTRYASAMDSHGPFFQAQIVIYGHRMGCALVELPVRLAPSGDERATRFRLLRDGADYLAEVVREKYKLLSTAVSHRTDEQ
jgi:glycosyltransferase involved in cell wall biosynthesis